MPIRIPFTGEVTYNKHELDNKLAGAVSAAIVTSGSKSQTDSLEYRYRGTIPVPGYLLRDPFYNAPWWYPVPFECTTETIAARILARKSDKTNVRQSGLTFTLASASSNTWSAGETLLIKLGFYATGEMKIEIGSEAQFTGGTHDVWKSPIILDSALQTEFANGSLHIETVGRIVFRFAV
jgi:hypothetical protein